MTGPLVEVMEDGTVAKPRPETVKMLPVGLPALQNLVVEKVPSPDQVRHQISGTAVSTNAGGPRPDCGIYIPSEDGRWWLRAISNRKGEFDFDQRTAPGTSLVLYLSSSPVGVSQPTSGWILREYPLKDFVR